MKKETRKTAKVIAIEVGASCDAWYRCSDGHTYYEPCYDYDVEIGDEIAVDDYEI